MEIDVEMGPCQTTIWQWGGLFWCENHWRPQYQGFDSGHMNRFHDPTLHFEFSLCTNPAFSSVASKIRKDQQIHKDRISILDSAVYGMPSVKLVHPKNTCTRISTWVKLTFKFDRDQNSASKPTTMVSGFCGWNMLKLYCELRCR